MNRGYWRVIFAPESAGYHDPSVNGELQAKLGVDVEKLQWEVSPPQPVFPPELPEFGNHETEVVPEHPTFHMIEGKKLAVRAARQLVEQFPEHTAEIRVQLVDEDDEGVHVEQTFSGKEDFQELGNFEV